MNSKIEVLVYLFKKDWTTEPRWMLDRQWTPFMCYKVADDSFRKNFYFWLKKEMNSKILVVSQLFHFGFHYKAHWFTPYGMNVWASMLLGDSSTAFNKKYGKR